MDYTLPLSLCSLCKNSSLTFVDFLSSSSPLHLCTCWILCSSFADDCFNPRINLLGVQNGLAQIKLHIRDETSSGSRCCSAIFSPWETEEKVINVRAVQGRTQGPDLEFFLRLTLEEYCIWWGDFSNVWLSSWRHVRKCSCSSLNLMANPHCNGNGLTF